LRLTELAGHPTGPAEMPRTKYWADNYISKKMPAFKAMSHIRPGQRVFIGSSCGEPQALVRSLAEEFERLSDLEIVRLLSVESSPLTLIAKKNGSSSLNIRSFYSGSARPKELARNIRFITPINLSAVPRLFRSRLLPIHTALIQVTPPDDFGWMSLGVSVDITLAAAKSADLVIAQVNARMPRVLGRSFLHVNDVDIFVERDEELLTIESPPESETGSRMSQMITKLIDDGSTIQIGLGTTPQAVLQTLSEKNDLGIHTQYLSDNIMRLVSRGVVTNRKKGFNEDKLVASAALGTKDLYEFLDDNPSIEFYPSDYVNDPGIISRHNKMVSMNVAMEIDLTGQVAADAFQFNYFTGVSGMLDFIRGAAQSPGGKSFLILNATSAKGKKSNIVPFLADTAVVVPRSDVQYVVTEFGVVNLFGKSIQERALALISIAHPAFRDELFHIAQKMGLLGPERTLKESICAVYPVKLEEVIRINGEEITIRPAKPVDERGIQEHYYNLEKDDVISRFFREKDRFKRDEMETITQVDYINSLTIVAVIGELGFDKVVAVGEYLLDHATNMAEVAFSVSKGYKGRGIGKAMLKKLAEAARENGISGLTAYTSAENQRMIRLFKSLAYRSKATLEEGMIMLQCRFDEHL
jgi:acyl-CoA hydrolase/GNAT superfamily N-acetyltransferase